MTRNSCWRLSLAALAVSIVGPAIAQTPQFLFAPSVPSGMGPSATEIVDMNGDGRKDIVTVNAFIYQGSTNGTVSVMLANGSGGYGTPQLTEVENSPHDMEVADFNGDGSPDVVVVHHQSEYANVLWNDGSGNLAPPVRYYAGYNAQMYSVAVGDFDGDGSPDFAVPASYEGTVRIYRYAGN